MDCREAQEQILESIADGGLAVRSVALENHLAECVECRSFCETQSRLDLELSGAIQAPVPSDSLRASLMRRIRSGSSPAWSHFLPDVAHLGGGACATGLCLLLAPWPPSYVISAGAMLTLATYLVQCLVSDELQAWEERPCDPRPHSELSSVSYL